jgi:hypothetical protein
MFHLASYTQNRDPAGVFTLVNATQDPTLATDGTNGIKVPSVLPYVVGQAALFNTATGTLARFDAPSLNSYGGLPQEPIAPANTFAVPAELSFHPEAPLLLEPEEMLSFGVISSPGASVLHTGLIWLSDGITTPIFEEMFSVRATANADQAAREWREGNITFPDPLPVGTYLVVGLRVRSASGACGRLIFQNQHWRPGAPNAVGISDDDTRAFRFGKAGVFGVFQSDLPPVLEMLNGTATSQVLTLDLVRF